MTAAGRRSAEGGTPAEPLWLVLLPPAEEAPGASLSALLHQNELLCSAETPTTPGQESPHCPTTVLGRKYKKKNNICL